MVLPFDLGMIGFVFVYFYEPMKNSLRTRRRVFHCSRTKTRALNYHEIIFMLRQRQQQVSYRRDLKIGGITRRFAVSPPPHTRNTYGAFERSRRSLKLAKPMRLKKRGRESPIVLIPIRRRRRAIRTRVRL